MRIEVALFLSFISIRLFFAACQRTYFVPDEHWQAPEIAHRIVFSTGETTWEWLPEVAIRGYLHPMIFAFVFKLLSIFSVDSDFMIAYSPRFSQAVIAALGDLGFYLLAKYLFGRKCAIISTALQLTNWFSLFSLSRPTSNASASSLLLTSLWLLRSGHIMTASFTAGLAVCIRPTTVLFLIPSIAIGWLESSLGVLVHKGSALTAMIPFVSVLTLSGILDCLFYGRLTLTAVNFFNFNISKGVAKEYGVSSLYWFVLNAIPHCFLFCFPLVMKGWHLLPKYLKWPVVFEVFILSLSAHKELRFLQCSLCILALSAGKALCDLTDISSVNHGDSFRAIRKWLFILSIPHAVLGVYMSRWHQAAPEIVMQHLRDGIKGSTCSKHSVLFLTPCHATPFHSYVHSASVNGTGLKFLDCKPSIFRPDGSRSEREKFFMNPGSWAISNIELIKESNWVVIASPAEKDEFFIEVLKKEGFLFDNITEIFDSFIGEAPDGSGVIWSPKMFVISKKCSE